MNVTLYIPQINIGGESWTRNIIVQVALSLFCYLFIIPFTAATPLSVAASSSVTADTCGSLHRFIVTVHRGGQNWARGSVWRQDRK